MNLFTFEFLLQAGFAFGVFLSTVSRLGKTSTETIDEIRHSIWYVSVTSLLLIAAPFLPIVEPSLFTWDEFQTPHWVWVAFLFGVMTLQWSTSRHWGRGTPWSYLKESHRCERRTVVRLVDTQPPKDTQWPRYSHSL